MLKHIKPSRPGLVLRDHKAKYARLPDEGKMVPWDGVWAKRVRDGDAIIVEPQPAPKPVKASAPVDKPAASAKASAKPNDKEVK